MSRRLGLLGRGEKAEITTYLEKSLDSELSANVIDLCPVGALTSKPYAFVARPWELSKTESVDVLDAVGSAVRVDARGTEVLRILPRLNEPVNEEWLSDKGRYASDGLRRQRLDHPYVRRDGKLQPASWDEAFATIRDRLRGVPGSRIAAIAGDLCDAESMLALKELMTRLGSPNTDCRQGRRQTESGRACQLLAEFDDRRFGGRRRGFASREQPALGGAPGQYNGCAKPGSTRACAPASSANNWN